MNEKKRPKRCTECGKIIYSKNQSGLCCYHYGKKLRIERRLRLRLKKNEQKS